MKVAYVRVSTEEQNEARQIEALKKHGIEKWFTEKISGKSMDRPQLQAMLDYVREGDTVYIHDFSRFVHRRFRCGIGRCFRLDLGAQGHAGLPLGRRRRC